MPEEKMIVCPKCGSDDLVDWGTTSRMCRRCHEVFRIDEVRSKTNEPNVEEASRRAEDFLKELESKRLVGGETAAERTNAPPTPIQKPQDSGSGMVTMEVKGSDETYEPGDVAKEFEELFKDSSASSQSSYSYERREEPKRVYRSEERERQERVAAAQAQIVKPKKNKTVGCIVAGAVIAFWILMMIICSVLGK
jgi:hypothetical protein